MTEAKNPYGKRPGDGISLPDYYRPTPSVKSKNAYYPQQGNEILESVEMRI